MSRSAKGRIGCGGVANLGVEADIGGGIPPCERRIGLHRGESLRHRRQRRIIDDDCLRPILSRSEGGSDHHCDDFAGMVRRVHRHRKMLGNKSRRAVHVRQRDVGRMPRPDRMRYRPQTIGQ
jgi:hypothetical protein